MISARYFYLYLVLGILSLVLAVINLTVFYPAVKTSSIIIEVIMMVFFFYLAYKTWQEKKNKELM